MKVIRNTYPVQPKVPHAEKGDIVHWEHGSTFRLMRESDRKIVFSTGPVAKDGKLRSNGKSPLLFGIIAQLKSKGWILEIK